MAPAKRSGKHRGRVSSSTVRNSGYARLLDGLMHSRSAADLLACVHLCAQQVEAQVRMNLAHFGGMIAPPVVAFGERRNRVDMPHSQGLLPLGLVELSAYIGYVRGSVKVQMNLAKTQFIMRQRAPLCNVVRIIRELR